MLLLQAQEHVQAECRALQKNAKTLTVTPADIVDISFPKEYAPFVSPGIMSLLCSLEKTSVPILQDTGAAQSLILEDVLPFPGSLPMEK